MTTKEFNLLTVAEVAEAYRCDPDTVRRWVRNRKLPAVALLGAAIVSGGKISRRFWQLTTSGRFS
jgi:excisionase family DNA binding protein